MSLNAMARRYARSTIATGPVDTVKLCQDLCCWKGLVAVLLSDLASHSQSLLRALIYSACFPSLGPSATWDNSSPGRRRRLLPAGLCLTVENATRQSWSDGRRMVTVRWWRRWPGRLGLSDCGRPCPVRRKLQRRLTELSPRLANAACMDRSGTDRTQPSPVRQRPRSEVTFTLTKFFYTLTKILTR